MVADPEELISPEGWPYASTPPVEPDDPGRFNALFGRDSLITCLQLLPVRPDLARVTLRTLAALQGRRDDPALDEQPGKILHEWWQVAPSWLVRDGWPVRDGELRYYGSADSTSWFLVVLAALGDRALEVSLESAWRAAGAWLVRALEDGGGFVRYGPRAGPGGLQQQGWRDTVGPEDANLRGSGIARPDGSAPAAPLADADCQAVAVAGLRALATLTLHTADAASPADAPPTAGASPTADQWLARAAAFVDRIGAAFDPDTLAIEAHGAAVPGAGSQLGWLLWADALPADARDRAADRLCRPDVLTPWGLRTLSAEHPRFAPDAYHRGGVWPFDSWLGWGGLRAAGRTDVAECLRTGVLDGIHAIGRAPELFAVTERGPAPIGIANRMQAWTVGARWALEHEHDGRSVPRTRAAGRT